MIKLFVLTLLITQISSEVISTYKEIVKPTQDQCECEQILTQSDCSTKEGCGWVSISNSSGTCSKTSSDPKTFCSLILEKPYENCSKTKGCAYVQGKCEAFAGCTSYSKSTNKECQAISYQCLSDGQQCTNTKPCLEYVTQNDCESFPSSSGKLKCKWENQTCRDYSCTEAESSLKTDADCDAWIAGCVTTGMGCTSTLGPCSGYQENAQNCAQLKGTDGNCEIGPTEAICRAKICSNAPTTITTDSECQIYQTNCLTNGKGCVSLPLPTCSSYQGDNITCVGYIGSDGICEGDVEGTVCRALECSKASASNNTDELCKAYKVGCVTTGKGCIAILQSCSSYQGTIASCQGYIGTDGKCKGINTTEQPCQSKVCSEAENTLNTDSACTAYQIGCKTTGKGCTSQLGSCSTYQGTTATCQGYIGTDGNCKGTSAKTIGPCSARVCSEAPNSTTTNQACAQYQKGCVTNGAGCVAIQSCLNTIKQISCEGTEGCTWNSICVSGSDCANYPTISICLGNKANGKPCLWTGTSCRNLTCIDADQTNNSNDLCNTFLAGCITNGKGCVAADTACNLFLGTKQQCENYLTTTKCYNTNSATSTTPCIIKSCTQASNSQTDSDCEQFLPGCVSNGHGCVSKESDCSIYQGTQSECSKFKGSNQTAICWNTDNASSTTSCVEKRCAHLSVAKDDAECEAFLSGCIFNGQGCTLKSSSCNAFRAKQSECQNFKGENGNKACWSSSNDSTIIGTCRDKTCADASNSLTSNTDCEAFLSGCVTNGGGCVSSTAPCSTYQGTMSECAEFIGNGQQCYKDDYCIDRQCSDLASPKDNDECSNYLPKCRFYKGKCIEGVACTAYVGNSLNECQNLIDKTSSKCWWTLGNTCDYRTCENAPSNVANQADCSQHLESCFYQESNKCVQKGTCTSYKVYGNGDNCKSLKDDSNKLCWFVSGSNCTDRTCANASSPTNQSSCDDHKENCLFLENFCVNPANCSSYTVSGSDSEKLTKCKSLKNKEKAGCTWSNGKNCEDITCSQVSNPIDQSSCDAYLPNSCSFKFLCEGRSCAQNTTATTHAMCTEWLSGCSWNGTTGCQIQKTSCSDLEIPSTLTTDQKTNYCQEYKTLNAKQCIYTSYDNVCKEKGCGDISIDPYQSNNEQKCESFGACSWIGSYQCSYKAQKCTDLSIVKITPNTQFSICTAINVLNKIKCQDDPVTLWKCIDRKCNRISDATTQTECSTWLDGCQWTGTTGCEDPKSTCDQITASGANDSAKLSFCQGYTITQGKSCTFKTGDSNCSSICPTATAKTNSSECTAFNSACVWDQGTSCEMRVLNCSSVNLSGLSTEVATTKCNEYSPINKNKCYYDGGSCKQRLCNMNTTAINNTECTAFLSACQWNGTTGCHDTKPACASVPVVAAQDDSAKKTYCEQQTTFEALPCGYISGSTNCTNKCNTATGMTSFESCNTFLAGCQWNGGSSCMVKAESCDEVSLADAGSNQTAVCFGITTKLGRPCLIDSGNTCKVRNCQSATGMTSHADCKAYLSTCNWNGGTGCGSQYTGCPPNNISQATTLEAKRQFCLGLTLLNSTGQCVLNSEATMCVMRTCTNAENMKNSSDCNLWLSGCQWDGLNSCMDMVSNCSAVILTATTLVSKQQVCNNVITKDKVKCKLLADGSGCETLSCNLKTDATSNSDCLTHNTICRYVGTPTCIQADFCSNYTIPTSLVNKDQICSALTDAYGAQCKVKALVCTDKVCSNAVDPKSQDDCTQWKTGCKYIGNKCSDSGVCSSYNVTGSDNSIKRTICNNLGCEYVDNARACTDKTCSNVRPTATDQLSCTNWLSKCRWNGIECVDANACTNYTFPISIANDSAKTTYCSTIKDNSLTLNPCIYVSATSTTSCQSTTCENYPGTPLTNDDCKNHKSSCSITYEATAKCIVNTTSCSGFTGTPDQCKLFIGNGKPCWQNSSVTERVACIERICAHNTTAKTNEECQQFKTGCKTNGTGCIDSTTSCSSLMGNLSTCAKRLANDGISLCTIGQTTKGQCRGKTCYDDGSSTTDAQCQAFMKGCVTNGFGCIPSSEPCTSYKGDQTKCSGFMGNSKKCWNSTGATSTSPCRDKTCVDDTQSTTDQACAQTASECITKGTGCLPKSSPCSAYQGTSSICSKFKGSNGVTDCWNTTPATATTSCIEKVCNLNKTATTDSECDAFIPKATGSTTPKCVTNGLGCVDYPRLCSSFTGTSDECSKFTASDGPCKSTAPIGKGPCAARICTEALNSNNTDALCKSYHPTCVTTGHGCVSSVNCKDIQDSQSCKLRSECVLVENCRSIQFDCSVTKTNDGASICVNTQVSTGNKQCAWAQSCVDLSVSLNTHEACQAKLNTCTTNGTGCIPIGICSSYTNEKTCGLAKSTEQSKTCIWENNNCRAKKCTDALEGLTDEICNSYLSGCRTNGKSCIESPYNCTSLVTAEKCIKDSYNKPCLFVENVCYNFEKCEDISKTTHSECQKFSNKCTTDGVKCIAITTCEKTILQVSCIIGTDGDCGWLPTNGAQASKCQKYGNCSDAISTDKASCQAYGKSCISDGSKCIEMDKCINYLSNQVACLGGGTDSPCIFESRNCRQRECKDAADSNASKINTHEGCVAFTAKTKCTTNGNSCIPQSTCDQYTEKECFEGTDGICVYAQPVDNKNQYTPKSCRLRVCEDLQLNSPEECAAKGCIYNSSKKHCLRKYNCTMYGSKSLCNQGGTDGYCAYLPSTGFCKLMTKCSDANSDRTACEAHPNTCLWKSVTTTDGSSTSSYCQQHDCSTKANGTECNPVPNFDGTEYTICVYYSDGCYEQKGDKLSQGSCFGKSMGTYTWNNESQTCQACFQRDNSVGNQVNGSSVEQILVILTEIMILIIAI